MLCDLHYLSTCMTYIIYLHAWPTFLSMYFLHYLSTCMTYFSYLHVCPTLFIYMYDLHYLSTCMTYIIYLYVWPTLFIYMYDLPYLSRCITYIIYLHVWHYICNNLVYLLLLYISIFFINKSISNTSVLLSPRQRSCKGI